MTDEEPLRIVGVPASPYSRKLRAVLRYRRIPYAWVLHGSPEGRGLPAPRVPLLPHLVVRGADGVREAVVDSTPLIRRLETTYAGRAVVPPDSAIAFIDALDLAASFEAWDRLRAEQRLGRERAHAVMERMVLVLVAGLSP